MPGRTDWPYKPICLLSCLTSNVARRHSLMAFKHAHNGETRPGATPPRPRTQATRRRPAAPSATQPCQTPNRTPAAGSVRPPPTAPRFPPPPPPLTPDHARISSTAPTCCSPSACTHSGSSRGSKSSETRSWCRRSHTAAPPPTRPSGTPSRTARPSRKCCS